VACSRESKTEKKAEMLADDDLDDEEEDLDLEEEEDDLLLPLSVRGDEASVSNQGHIRG